MGYFRAVHFWCAVSVLRGYAAGGSEIPRKIWVLYYPGEYSKLAAMLFWLEKHKKIGIQGVHYISDKYGNRKKENFTVATVWAYFRQLSGNEIYRVTTQATEEVMFIINYRTDITTENVILYKGVQYNIVRVDVFEGYKSDLTLYCKRQV